ncbi:hydrogenase maturation nickel metallochaperone HypA [Sporomusa sp. KB1]|jgi:hydrogenase nickel incorporation protein HypA/HybF|uniref:hydrogenase maturation nickel metallochaperone HypA/HybF n=1 Tax=Sporomusa sp. KB1 TaxID=943346 RepID=UPI0011A17693|nr:hydrogenase maturation nickel metallochaperone HypA [Sporomusa sp. KB1]TWH46707.1 hydrogenase nickel incorporation protein HypA/HybF [Sporomusa sp. KB1]
MHELAIAQGILDIALSTAVNHNANSVLGVKVIVGELTGTVPEALEFGFVALAKGTMAENACLSIRIIPLTGHCRDCGSQSSIDKYCFACASCGSHAVEIITGRELKVESVEVE